MTRRLARLLLVLLAAGLVAVPGLTRPTAASWQDRTHLTALITVASAACTTVGLFTTAASAAQLAGTVQGASIGGSAAFAPAATGVRADAVTRSTSLSVAAPGVGTTPTVAGVALPVLLTGGASWAQTAATSGTGTATATAGGGADFGTVDVSALLARTPSAGSRLPGLTGVALDVGRIDATARLDGCAAAFGASNALTRSAGVGSLALRFTDGTVVDDLGAIGTDAGAAAAGLATRATTAAPLIDSAAGGALLTAVQQALAALSVTGATVSTTPNRASVSAVTVPAVGAAPVVQPAAPLRLDTGTGATRGQVVLDLSGAVSGPNADVVTGARMSTAATSLGTALAQQAAAASAAVTTARDATSIAVRASVDVATTVLGVPTTICSVSVDQTQPASVWTGGQPPATALTVTARGGTPIPGLTAAVAATLPGLLPAAVQGAVTSSFTAPTTTSIAAAARTTADRLAADGPTIAAHLAAVPATVQATADLRPSTAADDWTGTAGPGRLTALRIRVLDAAGTRADLFLGDVLVGPAAPVAS